LAIIVGLVALLYGYRLFLILLPIWGFFSGFAIGATATSAFFGGGFLATIVGWVIGFFVGLVFAVLSYLFYIVGVALLSATFGFFLGYGFMLLFMNPSLIPTAILTGILLLFGRIPFESLGENPVQLVIQDSWFWLIGWLVLGIIGFAFQINSNRTFVLEAPENRI
jgi:hypothetical protein